MAQHLFDCPHCNEPGIRIWAKYWARPHDPAVCHFCNKASSISDAIETASTWLYFIAGFCAFTVLAMQMMSSAGERSFGGPTPVVLLASLLVVYFAVEAAKIYWAPLKAFSDRDVAERKSTSKKIAISILAVLFAAMFLEKCSY